MPANTKKIMKFKGPHPPKQTLNPKKSPNSYIPMRGVWN